MMDGLPLPATLEVPAPMMAIWYRERARDLSVANADLMLRLRRQAELVERQADRIELLEALLAAQGPRAAARLRRSPPWLRLLRRLGWVA